MSPPSFAILISVGFELLGAVAFGYGLWSIYSPLAWIWGGIACYGISVTVRPKPST